MPCHRTFACTALACWLWSIHVLFDWSLVESLLPTSVNCGLKFLLSLSTQACGSFFASWHSFPLCWSASFETPPSGCFCTPSTTLWPSYRRFMPDADILDSS